MRLCTSMLLAIFTGVAGTFSSPAAEQPKTVAAPAPAVPDAAAAWKRRLPELIVDGLPLNEVVEGLRKQFPELNFLVRPVHGIDVNAMSVNEIDLNLNAISVRVVLRNVTLTEILKAIELAAERPIQITGAPNERLVVFERQPAKTAESTVVTRAYNLAAYLAGRSEGEANQAMEHVYNAIAVTSELVRKATGKRQPQTDPVMRMHNATKLLIVVGRSDELEIVDQIVGALQGTAMTVPPSVPERPTAPARPAPPKTPAQP